MFRELFSYRTRLMPHEVEALSQIYHAIDPGMNLDASIILNALLKWKNTREYQLTPEITTWALPRLWGKPILDGLDSDHQVLAHIEVDGIFGLPTQINVSATSRMKLNRRLPVPVSWRFLNLDFARRPPLTSQYIKELEENAKVRLPQDLIEFMTSDRGAAIRHVMGPLTSDELVEPDEWNYYRILTACGAKDLLLRLNHDNESRDQQAKAYVVDYSTHEMILLATGVEEAVSKFFEMCDKNVLAPAQ